MRQKIKQIKNDSALIGQQVVVKGWVRTVRNQKTFSFIEMNDGSTLSNLQVVLEDKFPNYSSLIEKITTGAALAVKGELVKSPGGGQTVEVHAKEVEIVGACDPESYPLQKKRHSLEFLRTIAHLRPRTNTLGAVARVRNAIAIATHRFFQERDFIYIHSPIITASDCEGAGQLFRVTTLNPEKIAQAQQFNWEDDFFGRPTYLTVSGQLNGEIFASSHSDIYTFGPTFRAENSNTSRHLAEFWMIEPEMAFADLNDNMDNAEAYVRYVLKEVVEKCAEEVQFFEKFLSKGLAERLEHVVESEFERASYTYAIRILERSKKKFTFPIHWGVDLQTEHERYLCEEHFKKPVILYDYPKTIKPFYMRLNSDDKTVAGMDLLVPGVGEIVGGSQREERLGTLSERLKEAGLSEKDYWWYLELRKFGSVPHAGYGVGFERLVQFATGLENIRDINPFPRYPGKAEF